MTIALCCDDTESSEKIKMQISSFCDMPVRSYESNKEFLSSVSDRQDLIMLVAQSGALSAETAMSSREHNPKGKLIWFCDLDFALLSYRLKATYFGLMPIDDEKLKTAISYCLNTDGERRR